MKLAFYKAYGKNATLLDNVIGIASLGTLSHVEGVFSDGQCFSASPRDGGTRWKVIDFDPDNWIILDLPLSEKQEAEIRSRCTALIPLKYAYCGAILSITPICFQLPKRAFCSQLWVYLLFDIIVSEFGLQLKDPCKYSPQELYNTFKGFFHG